MTTKAKPLIERAPLVEGTVHSNPIIDRVLKNRGISSMAEMGYSLKDLIDPSLMANMGEAVIMLDRHIRNNSRIVVVGDFDCDGATSTSIAVAGLRLLGASDMHFLIPDRMIHGYGLTPSIVQLAGELEPDLVLTVDNGIASFEGAEAVRALPKRCELLVTDHHLASDKGLPDADVIVNPNQPDCPFPSKNLAGCGVMFYVIMALRAYQRDSGFYAEKGMSIPNISSLLDLVALGTVADVVPLDRNNRILIEAGLSRIRKGLGRPGIRALLEIAKKDPSKIQASDFGFALGPRINAAGRLDDMTLGIQCLLTDDEVFAMNMAQRLEDLNLMRREIEASHCFDADLVITEHALDQLKGVVIFDPTWHAGVVGIVASRIKDSLNRPIICMTDTTKASEKRSEILARTDAGETQAVIEGLKLDLLTMEVKGSARSIEGIHLKHVLDHINKRHPEILTKFGGHAMAAGLSLRYEHLGRFKELFNAEVAKEITPDQMLGSITVDIMDVDPSHMSLDLAHELRSLGPWGQHFPEPTFHAKFTVIDKFIMKEKHVKYKVVFDGHPGKVYEAIAFGIVKNGICPAGNQPGDRFDGAFRLDINEFRGNISLQLMLEGVQAIDHELVLEAAGASAVVPESEPTSEHKDMPVTATSKPIHEGHSAGSDGQYDGTRIKGASKRTVETQVGQVRYDMKSALEAIKSAGTNRVHVADNTPVPF